MNTVRALTWNIHGTFGRNPRFDLDRFELIDIGLSDVGRHLWQLWLALQLRLGLFDDRRHLHRLDQDRHRFAQMQILTALLSDNARAAMGVAD